MEEKERYDVSGRKKLRKEFLQRFYDYSFESGGKEQRFTLQISDNPEEAMAIRYLVDTGLLYCRSEKGILFVRISPRGIDFIEEEAEF